MVRSSRALQSHDQNFWQLGSIQSVGLGLPGIFYIENLAKEYGAGSTVLSIIIGNLILWLIGMVVISMVSQNRINAIENIKSYIGKFGGLIAALVFMFAFINWYGLQIYSSISDLESIFDISSEHQKSILIRLGAGLGLLTALLASGGIRIIKWIACLSLPILFIYYLSAIVISDYSVAFAGTWGFSFSGILACVVLQLPGMVNLPTFFRHSRSRADSYLALTYFTIFIIFFEIASIWLGFSHFMNISSASLFSHSIVFHLIAVSIFVVLLLICNNLLNIYFASACWESIIPRFGGPKGFAIIGLVGTAIYTFIQISTTMLFLVNLANSYIINLGIVLLIAFLVRIVVRHRPREFEKIINGASWVVGCVTATILEVQNPDHNVSSLLSGVGASALFFLCIIFIEETVWAAKKIMRILPNVK